MKYLRGMRGIKPTPLKLYFIATPATDGPSLATPSKSCFYYSPIPFASMLVAPSSHPIPVLSILSLSRFLHFSHLHSCTIVYTTSQYGGEQSHPLFPPPNSLSLSPFPSLPPSLSRSFSLLSATDPPDVAFRHITKRQKPVCRSNRWEARGISHPKRFYLSVASPTYPSHSVARTRHNPTVRSLSLSVFFFASSLSLPNAISLVDRNIFRGYTRIGGGEFITVTDHPLFLSFHAEGRRVILFFGFLQP